MKKTIIQKALIAAIKGYQSLGPHLWSGGLISIVPSGCRYHPSCSEYCISAISEDGVVGGSLKSLKRIIKCNPLFNEGTI